MSKPARFVVIDGSHSAHCCFTYSVIDTTEGKEDDGNWKKCICETIDLEDADLICDALNEVTPNDPEPLINVTENIQQTINVIQAEKIIKDGM